VQCRRHYLEKGEGDQHEEAARYEQFHYRDALVFMGRS
jgi:hypothetical protein